MVLYMNAYYCTKSKFVKMLNQSKKNNDFNATSICKILVTSNFDVKSSEKVKLLLIWEKLIRLEGNLTTFI